MLYHPDHPYTGSQWLLAFRATSGNGESVYDAWYNNGTYHDFPVGGDSSTPITCWSTSASCSCSHHLRSKLLDLWHEGSISPQRVSGCVFVSVCAWGVGRGESCKLLVFFRPVNRYCQLKATVFEIRMNGGMCGRTS